MFAASTSGHVGVDFPRSNRSHWSNDPVGTMEGQRFVQIGRRQAWGGEEPALLSAADRRQHLYVIGKTGTGKTTLLRNLILQDIQAGAGVAVIDPHGDLSFELLNHIPRWRTDHLVYFDPADDQSAIGLNLLQQVSPSRRHLVASGVVSAFKSIWADSWGPRLEYVLYSAVAALLECQNTSLLGVQRMLVDHHYRSWVVDQVKDPMVRSFWLDEFAGFDKRLIAEIIAPIQNKVGQLLMAPPVRNILGQVKSKIDARFMMDDRRIFIANLSKGSLGSDKAHLLGAILVTQFQLAAMSRTDVPEESRGDFHLYVDECHNFLTDSFTSILSEARKYGLCLTLSHQYTAQLGQETLDAVLGNVGNIVSFRVGEKDGKALEREFSGGYPATTFSLLPNYQALVRLMNQGEPRDPFLISTEGPFARRYGHRDNLIARSRQKYAVPKSVVERKIRRWMEPK